MNADQFVDVVRRRNLEHDGRWRLASVDFDKEYDFVKCAWTSTSDKDWYRRILGNWNVTLSTASPCDAKEKPIGIDEII